MGIDPIGGPALADGFAPAGGFYDPPLPNGDPGYVLYGSGDTVGSDLVNAGDDYAIRVQQFDADVEGRINETFSWRVNFWGMKKEGTRQANTQQHCFRDTPAPGGSTCHVTSQGQRIDWMTMEVEPVIDANFEWFSVEYSRTMRSFQQDDQMVMADFTSGSSTRYGLGGTGAYAFVPENYTEIDRLKLRSQLSCNTDLYVLGFVGNTHNKFRESDRKFYGVDARVTNQSIDGLNLVAYGKTHVQNNSADTHALNDRYPGDPQWLEAVPPQEFHEFFTGENQYLGLVDRHWSSIGFKSRWRPFYDSCGLANGFAMIGGYEWSEIKRTSVDYELDNLGEFTQPTTVSNMFFVGVQEDWSPGLTSYLRYRMIANSWPIVGITERAQADLDPAINSNQPEHVGMIEMGGTWSVADDFMLSGTFWIQNKLQPFGIRQLLRNRLSVHPQCLVHTQRLLVVRRRLRQSDQLDQPGRHVGPRRRRWRRTGCVYHTLELHGKIRCDQRGGQLCGVRSLAVEWPGRVCACRELLPGTCDSRRGC